MEQSIPSPPLDTRRSTGAGLDMKTAFGSLRLAAAGLGRHLAAGASILKDQFGSGTPETLDVDRLSARLKIEERARSDGGRELPSSTEEVVTGTQREIISYFKGLQRKVQRSAMRSTDKIRKCGDEIDILDVEGCLLDIPSSCENELLRISAQSQSQLRVLEERASLQQRDYEAFREENMLKRLAEYPRTPIFHFVLLAVLTAVGAVVIGNAPTFALTGERIFSPLAAVSLALIMTIPPFALGVVFRSVNHVRASRRLVAWLAGTFTMLLAVLLAAFLAYYTTFASADPSFELRSVPGAIWSNPGGLSTELSVWVIPGIVLVLGLAAAVTGYKSDDRYPGYGDVQRAFYRARDQRDALIARLRKRVNVVIDNAGAKADALRKRLKTSVKQYSRLLEEAKRLPVELNDYSVVLEDTCNILLDRYRVINAHSRRSNAPISFSEHVSFRLDRDRMADILDEQQTRMERYQQAMVKLENEAAQVRQKLKNLNYRMITPIEESAENRFDQSGTV